MFWYGWNSWAVELSGGAALALAAWLACRDVAAALALCVALSAFYEGAIDPNGWDWRDLGQRQAGIFAGLAVWPAILRLGGVT